LHSGEHLAITTGESVSVASKGGLFASIRNGWHIFTHNFGMRIVAAANNIEFKALTGSIDMLAKLEITETAETIDISAKKELTLQGGDSYTRMNASGIAHSTSGAFTRSRGSYAAASGHGTEVRVPLQQAVAATDEHFILKASDGKPLADRPYRLLTDDGKVIEGVTDHEGKTLLLMAQAPKSLKAEVFPQSALTIKKRS